MADHHPSPSGPLCPKCQSDQTTPTVERFGERFYFCAACEHTWSVLVDRLAKKMAQPKPKES